MQTCLRSFGFLLFTFASLLGLAIYSAGVVALYNYAEYQKAGLMLLSVLVLALVFWRLESLVRSPWGRVLKAIREDEEVASSLGKNVFWYKLQSLMLGGAIAGAAGALHAWHATSIYPNDYDAITRFVLPAIIPLDAARLGAFRIMVIGLILMVLMVWRPQGILGKKEELTLGK